MSDTAEQLNGHAPPADDYLERLQHEIFTAEQTKTPEEFGAWLQEKKIREVVFLMMLQELEAAPATKGPQGLQHSTKEEKPAAQKVETLATIFGPNLESFRWSMLGLRHDV